MIKINRDHLDWEQVKENHYNYLKDKFVKWLEANKNEEQFTSLKKYLWNENDELNIVKVEKILVGNHSELKNIMRKVGEIVNKKTESKDTPYDHFTRFKKGKSFGYQYLKKLKVDVCPYCNLHYTFTIEKAKRRPQFDHFYPKSKYAYLQVSLHNLIPSCQSCNAAKTADDFNEEQPIYFPLEEGVGEDTFFQTVLKEADDFSHWLGFEGDFEVRLTTEEGNKEAEKYIKGLQATFNIQDLYKSHLNDYVQDIIRNLILYNESRMKELHENFEELFDNEKDVIDTILMNRIQVHEWGKRPLGKLTHDIYKEFMEKELL